MDEEDSCLTSAAEEFCPVASEMLTADNSSFQHPPSFCASICPQMSSSAENGEGQ